jgi:hypothetical protein
MAKKNDIALTLAEGAAVAALIGVGSVAVPLAAAAYGVWRFMPDGLLERMDRTKKDAGE